MINTITSLWLWVFQIFYSRDIAMVLHRIPIVIFVAVPFFLRLLNSGLHSWFATYCDFVKGRLYFPWFILSEDIPMTVDNIIICLLFKRISIMYFNSCKKLIYIVYFVYFTGTMLHTIGIILAIIFPIIFSVLRLLFSSYAMSWCASLVYVFL